MSHPEQHGDALQQVSAHRGNEGFLWVEEKDDFVLSPLEVKTDLDLQKQERVTRTAKQTTRFHGFSGSTQKCKRLINTV